LPDGLPHAVGNGGLTRLKRLFDAKTGRRTNDSFYRNFRRIFALLPSIARIGVARLIQLATLA